MKIVVPSKNQLDNDRRRQTCIQSAGQEPPCSLPAFLWLCVSLFPSIGKTLCQRTEYFFIGHHSFFRNQENGGADMTIVWSGTVDGSKAFQHFLAPAFMGCYVFILFCWMSKSINEVGHRQLCSSAGDGAMASQVQSSVDGWESHRCKGNLIRGVFSKVPQISGERELSDLVLTTPDVFGTQASRLPDSTVLNILLISRRGRGLDFLATMQICNNKIKNKRKWGEHYRTTDPIRKKKLLTKWKEFV